MGRSAILLTAHTHPVYGSSVRDRGSVWLRASPTRWCARLSS